ncbi:hypothetical protein CsatA_011346 [Cannabis sativa]
MVHYSPCFPFQLREKTKRGGVALKQADSKVHIHWKGVSGDSLGLVLIGDGEDTNLWQSAWLNGYPLRDQPARITPSNNDLLLSALELLCRLLRF